MFNLSKFNVYSLSSWTFALGREFVGEAFFEWALFRKLSVRMHCNCKTPLQVVGVSCNRFASNVRHGFGATYSNLWKEVVTPYARPIEQQAPLKLNHSTLRMGRTALLKLSGKSWLS